MTLFATLAWWMATAWLVAPHPVVTDDIRQRTTGLTGVIGHWTESVDSTAIITVDGAKWSGQTPVAELTRASVQWFGSASDAFVRNGSAVGAFPLAVASHVARFTSGTLRVQFKMISGASDQNAGLVFDLAPTGEYLYARYNTKDGDLALWRFVNGERQIIVHGTGARQLALGTWHELVVNINGRALDVSVKGDTTLKLTATLDRVPTGRVGLWVKRDAVTAFRSFSATAAGR